MADIDLLGDGKSVQETARAAAKDIFRRITRLLGLAEAQRIFSDLATPTPKKVIEEMNNHLLLQAYIDYGGGEIAPLARHLLKRGKTIGMDFSTRGARPINEAKRKKQLKDGVEIKPETGIAKQLQRLLGKGPPKNASPALRMLVEEARQLPRSRRGPKRKKLGPNEIKPISALE
jgi:2-iminoacetate synthase ThiH